MAKDHLPNLSALRAFEAAARHSSFTRAAEELGLTQAAVSRHIRNLEEEIGVQLFRRTHRAVTLTDAGRRYAKRVSGGFASLRYRAHGTINAADRIVVEVDALLCRHWLLPRLRASGQSVWFKSLDIRIHREGTKELPIDTDIALTRGAHDREGFKRFRLLSPRLVGVVAPHTSATGLHDLKDTGYIHYRSDEDWKLLYRAAGLEFDETRGCITVDQPDQIIDATKLGLGAGTCEDVLAMHAVEADELHVITQNTLTCRNYYMATRKPRLARQAAEFAKWLINQGAETTSWQENAGTVGSSPRPMP